MTFKEEIDLQLKDNKVLSYEILSQLKNKTYFSGKEKEIGDTVLFGLLSEINTDGNIELKLITFHEEEINSIYEENTIYYKSPKESKIPIIKKIENGN